MPRGGGFGRGYGMRRVGVPIVYPMGGYGYGGMGMGSPLLTTLMAGGLGYAMGSNSGQQAAPQQAPYPPQPYPYPYQASPTAQQAPTYSADDSKLSQLKLLEDLHNSGTLSDDEFESEKQRILRG